MTPVFQTIIGNGGNCMQAAYASILDLPLEDVPHFLEGDDEHSNTVTRVDAFLKSLGLCEYRFHTYGDRKEVLNAALHALEFSGSKYCLLSVPSQMFAGATHCVVGQPHPEKFKFDVAHDPNPNNQPYDPDMLAVFEVTIIGKLL